MRVPASDRGDTTEPGARHAARLIAAGAISGAVAVMAGAFGAHALEHQLPADRFDAWDTAARYQLVHAAAIVALGAWRTRTPRAVHAAAWAFLAGSVLFPGSLYALALGAGPIAGMITPIGGLAFIAGWMLTARAALR